MLCPGHEATEECEHAPALMLWKDGLKKKSSSLCFWEMQLKLRMPSFWMCWWSLSSEKGTVMPLLYNLVQISWRVQNLNSEHGSRVQKYWWINSPTMSQKINVAAWVTNYATLTFKVSEECRNMIGKLLPHILENYFCG